MVWVDCCNCGFESRRKDEQLSALSVVCCQVEGSAQWSPAVCGGYDCELETSYRISRPTRADEPKATVAATERDHF